MKRKKIIVLSPAKTLKKLAASMACCKASSAPVSGEEE